jgi:hypothetical protein
MLGISVDELPEAFTEDKDLRVGEEEVREINTGIYCVAADFLFSALSQVTPQNAQKEYYLTDAIGIAVEEGLSVQALPLEDPEEGIGINTRVHLAEAESSLKSVANLLTRAKELAMQGASGGVMQPIAQSIMLEAFPPAERGKAMALFGLCVVTAPILGPVLGGWLTDSYSWRWVFYINIPIGMLALITVILLLDGEWADARNERFDLPGALLYGPALVLVMYGFSLLPDVAGVALILCGTFLLFGFVRWEQKAESPVLDLSLFLNNRPFAFSSLAALINYSATFA